MFLTDVSEVTPGVSAFGHWQLDGGEPFFEGHFPNRPTLPGVLMVEALAQLGAYAILLDERFKGKLPLFGGINKARFRKQVLPGDRLELSISLEKLSARGGTGSGKGLVGGKLAVEADLFFVVV